MSKTEVEQTAVAQGVATVQLTAQELLFIIDSLGVAQVTVKDAAAVMPFFNRMREELDNLQNPKADEKAAATK